jgi:hypothetical protein
MMARGGKSAICSPNALMPHMGHEIYGRFCLVKAYIYQWIKLSFCLQMFKTGMITVLSNSLFEQLNVDRRTCHIAMKAVSAYSFCSVIGWGARACLC